MDYLKNIWYPAAWDNEVTADRPLARRLLDLPLVLFRDQNGVACIAADACPHRLAPLSMGTIENGRLVCAYHGLGFDSSGACVHNPYGEVPRAARIAVYPVVERHSLIWFWPGDPAKADPALIPNYDFQDPETAYTGKGYLKANANYELEIENILDLSHIQTLHPTTLGSPGIATGVYESYEENGSVYSKRDAYNDIVPDNLAHAMGVVPGQPCDRWMHVLWTAPANMVIWGGAVAAGRPREEGRNTPTLHVFTPETETTSHYWFSIAFPRALGPQAEAMANEQVKFLAYPFEAEDLPMLEAQQRNLESRKKFGLKNVWLPGDAAGAKALGILRGRIAEERAGGPA